MEGAESNEQTNTQTDTVVEGGGEPQQVDGQEVPVPVQQTDSLQQTENVQQESVVASQQTGTEQQQSEQVTNSVEDPPQNVVPVAVVNEGLTQNSDQVMIIPSHFYFSQNNEHTSFWILELEDGGILFLFQPTTSH